MRDVLPDYLAPELRAIIVGTAAGDRSARRGHYYAGQGNDFWKLLAESGLTPVDLTPQRDAEIITYGLGLTDIAKRRSASTDSLLVRSDFDVQGFLEKVALYAPRWVAFHGKGAAREVSKVLGRGRSVSYGVQDWTIGSARVFVLPSASGLNREPNDPERRALRLDGRGSRLDWYSEFASTLAA